jgi:ElaB/YqjD/DUF883 family membrane-anchored ribosome-binding protein
MDTNNTFGKQGQAVADKAADKVQAGIREAQQTARAASATLSNKVDELRSDTGPMIGEAAGQAQNMLKQGLNAVGDATQAVRDTASDATDSVISYTKENPVKALLIAAVAGALLVTIVNALSPSRE